MKVDTTLVEWDAVNVFSQEDAIASVKANESPQYYIRYNDGYNNGLWGPYFNLTLTNSPPVLSAPNVFPLEGTYKDLFVYKVNVSDEDGDDVWVTLHIVDPQGGWIYNETHLVSGLDPKYLFCWDNLPRSESERIKRFFTDGLNIKWPENATISKDNDNTINISTDNHTAVIVMDANKENATIKIGGKEICTLEVKEENGKLKIYSKGSVTESWIYYFREENVSKNFSYTFTATDGIDYAKESKGVGPSFEPYKAGITKKLITAISTINIAYRFGVLLIIVFLIIGLLLYKRYLKREIEEEII